MADINKKLLTTADDTPAPQQKKKGENKFEFVEGSHGAQHHKLVDSAGNPFDVKSEINTIKRTQQDILEKLNGTVDTRQTGSIVELINSSNKKYNHADLHIGQREGGWSTPGINVEAYMDYFLFFENLSDVELSVTFYGFAIHDGSLKNSSVRAASKKEKVPSGSEIIIKIREDFIKSVLISLTGDYSEADEYSLLLMGGKNIGRRNN